MQHGAADQLAVSVRANQVVFEVAGVVLSSRLIDGQFPNYRQLLPDTYEHEPQLAGTEITEAVRRISLLAQKNAPLRLAFSEGELTVSAPTPDVGEARETVPVPFAGEPLAILDAQIDQYESCGVACWLATERATDRVVGYVGISVPTFYPEILPTVEVGWRFDPDVWGRGYVTEGARAALDQAFGPLGLERVCSLPQAENTASVAVAERLGMERLRT